MGVGVRVRGRVGGRARLGWSVGAGPAPAQIGQSGSASSAAVGGRCGCAPHAADQCSTPALLPLPELHTKSRATSTASGRLLTLRVAPLAPPPPPLAPPPPPLAPPPPAACRCGRSAMCSASCSSSKVRSKEHSHMVGVHGTSSTSSTRSTSGTSGTRSTSLYKLRVVQVTSSTSSTSSTRSTRSASMLVTPYSWQHSYCTPARRAS